MKASLLIPLLQLVISSSLPSASSYGISETIIGKDFYQHFSWETLADPTHGRVNYVDQQTSVDQNLTFASDNAFILRTDHNEVLDPNGPGRNSVRIKSNNVYASHVVIFDLRHMPQGCGTAPSIWELGQATWPQGGEIDIVEGVNDQGPDRASLHTTDGCTMPDRRMQKGRSRQLDCNSGINNDEGCSVNFESTDSYGPSFNDNGGGWYAMERSDTAINMWFWSRNSGAVPDEVKAGSSSVSPRNWGTPSANFPSDSCDLSSHFDAQNIIINLALCGDRAESEYGQSGCPSNCIDFVNNNPHAFINAYFEFASVRIYT